MMFASSVIRYQVQNANVVVPAILQKHPHCGVLPTKDYNPENQRIVAKVAVVPVCPYNLAHSTPIP